MINGLPWDLFLGRLFLGASALVAFAINVYIIQWNRTFFPHLQASATHALSWVNAVLLGWIGLLQLWGAWAAISFPNPAGYRIALQVGLPFLVLWPAIHTVTVRRRWLRSLS